MGGLYYGVDTLDPVEAFLPRNDPVWVACMKKHDLFRNVILESAWDLEEKDQWLFLSLPTFCFEFLTLKVSLSVLRIPRKAEGPSMYSTGSP